MMMLTNVINNLKKATKRELLLGMGYTRELGEELDIIIPVILRKCMTGYAAQGENKGLKRIQMASSSNKDVILSLSDSGFFNIAEWRNPKRNIIEGPSLFVDKASVKGLSLIHI